MPSPLALTTDEFKRRATLIHGTYDYSYANYINSVTKVEIICPIHGSFWQKPSYHLAGCNCPKCAKIITAKKHILSEDDFIRDASKIHNNKYIYTDTVYTGCYTKIKIICPEHGIFEQTANDHRNGHGCMKCAGTLRAKCKKTTLEEFIANARGVHGEKYDYANVEYKNTMANVSIFCKKHNSYFDQTPNNHVSGKAGCPKCSVSISKKEYAWLNYVGVPDTPVHRQAKIYINSKFHKVDGFIPETNTVYEFWGDYWHGNPHVYAPHDINKNSKLSFNFLYNRTLEKRKTICEAGFNLIEIWETDWDILQETLNATN